MKRAAAAAAWLCLIVLMALGPFWLAASVVSREDLIRRPYDSWTGVLRLWKCEGWESGTGTLTAWLGECAAAFEKQHPGAYIQITDVPEETLRSFCEGDVNPPDMILWAPGMLDAPYSLMPIENMPPVRETLGEAGVWQGTRYAVPVALGGYGMAINSRLIPDTPSDWSELTAADQGKKAKTEIINAPKDGSAQSWSAAMISLFAGGSSVRREERRTPAGEGIDVGLTGGEAEETEIHEQVTEEWLPNALPSVLPEDFRVNESVFSQFASGETAAIPVTQREIRRLQLLSESGKAPDWRVECIGLPFTDQIALYSVAAWPREDEEARQALAVEFMNLLLSEKMQRRLTAARAFAVLDIGDMYRNSRGLGTVEAALASENLLLPPAFGKEWRTYAARLADGLRGGQETQEAYGLLRIMLSGAE